jgi:hypothetical protein
MVIRRRRSEDDGSQETPGVLVLSGGNWYVDTTPGATPNGYFVFVGGSNDLYIDDAAVSGEPIVISNGHILVGTP